MRSESTFQQALVSAIINDSKEQVVEEKFGNGLALYQNNWLESAHRALLVSFPTVQKLLGEDNFRALCRFACKTIPKVEYDWGNWGTPNLFVEAVEQFLLRQDVNSLNYVIECAKLDELIFLSQRASDPILKADSLSLLNSEQGHEAVLLIADPVYIHQFSSPVDELYAFCHNAQGNIHTIKEKLSVSQKYFVKIHRTQFKPIVESVTGSEFALLQHAINETSVEQLFEKANELQIDFSDWLSKAITQLTVVGVKSTTNKGLKIVY